ncbi:hypothetical protein CIB48_g9376 [Xylaria polymorpha]|nr:hypothetical protein CIB48_g9376 [Xylaria polymorpha]
MQRHTQTEKFPFVGGSELNELAFRFNLFFRLPPKETIWSLETLSSGASDARDGGYNVITSKCRAYLQSPTRHDSPTVTIVAEFLGSQDTSAVPAGLANKSAVTRINENNAEAAVPANILRISSHFVNDPILPTVGIVGEHMSKVKTPFDFISAKTSHILDATSLITTAAVTKPTGAYLSAAAIGGAVSAAVFLEQKILI